MNESRREQKYYSLFSICVIHACDMHSRSMPSRFLDTFANDSATHTIYCIAIIKKVEKLLFECNGFLYCLILKYSQTKW